VEQLFELEYIYPFYGFLAGLVAVFIIYAGYKFI